MEKALIKNHCEITSSKRIFQDEYLLSPGVPFYRGKEISEKQRSSSQVSELIYISREKFEEIKSKFGAPQEGDLLLTSVGTIGNPYLVKKNEEFYFKDGNLTWFRNFNGINSQWLYYWLLSPQGKSELNKCTIGSSQKAYTINLLYGLSMELPNFVTQARIASIFSAYDDLIENNEKRIKALEEMAQLLYTEWFVKFKFPGCEKVKMVDSKTEYGVIPEGWGVKKLTEAVVINPPERVGDKNFVLHVPMEALSNTSCTINSTKTILKNKPSGARFVNGDTLFARITPCLENGKTGFVQFLRESEVACGSTEFVVLRSQSLTPEYVYFLSRDKNFRETAKLTMAGASGRQRVRSEFFKEYLVVQPPKELLVQYSKLVSNNFLEITVLFNRNIILQQTRDILIPQLVTGKREFK